MEGSRTRSAPFPRPPTLTGEAALDRPHYTGLSPGAIAPPAHSTVVASGEHNSPGDGSEDALPLLRMAERKWDLFPLPDSTVVSLGEALRPQRRGTESALPYLRMVRARSVHGHAQPNGPARPVHGHAPQRDALWPCTDLQRLLGRARADIQPSAALSPPGPSIASPLSTSPVGTTGQSPRVWTSRVGRPHPSPHPRKGPPTSPYPQNAPCPSWGNTAKQSKITPESAHQSNLPLHAWPVGPIRASICSSCFRCPSCHTGLECRSAILHSPLPGGSHCHTTPCSTKRRAKSSR